MPVPTPTQVTRARRQANWRAPSVRRAGERPAAVRSVRTCWSEATARPVSKHRTWSL